MLWWIKFVIAILGVTSAVANFGTKLTVAKKATFEQIKNITDFWEVDKYPLFLKSCEMHKSSWEFMKVRFMLTILRNNMQGNESPYVISFMGSSVAAGHDSRPQIDAYPVLVGEHMSGPFKAAGVDLITRNHALGNNPCNPYDACVATVVGDDADMVHWEQSYNCFDQPMYEQFARQSAFLPKKPLVVYSDSATPNWAADKCKPMPPPYSKLTEEEINLKGYMNAALKEEHAVTNNVEMIVSEVNQGNVNRGLAGMKDLLVPYSGLGIQGFTHLDHVKYQCLGPYIPTWSEGAASWHPSKIAHKMRAAHHAFFWLMAFREALIHLEALYAKNDDLNVLLKETLNKQHALDVKHSFPPSKLSTETPYVDEVQCYTGVVPIASKNHALTDLIVGGKYDLTIYSDAKEAREKGASLNGWGNVMIDLLITPEWTAEHSRRGRIDWKYVLYGDARSGPLSLKADVKKRGSIMICEVSGEWGQVPKGWARLQPMNPKFYITSNVDYKKSSPFEFNKDASNAMEIPWKKYDDFCVQLVQEVDVGTHVLTIVPTNDTFKFSFGFVLIP